MTKNEKNKNLPDSRTVGYSKRGKVMRHEGFFYFTSWSRYEIRLIGVVVKDFLFVELILVDGSPSIDDIGEDEGHEQ